MKTNTVTLYLRLEAALFLLPDLSIAAYWHGPAFGAAAYNAGHNYLAPAALYFVGLPLPFCLVWVAHITFDRVAGYGLKHLDGFKQTHLGQL